jgi:S-adenosylmethionine/arginine decarboxylase-like enzyme
MADGELNHRHIIVTAYCSNCPTSVEAGETWLRKLVDIVGMQILFDAKAIYCEDLGNEGVTGVVGLTTSHASFHSWHMAQAVPDHGPLFVQGF